MQREFCLPTSLSFYLDSLQVWSVHNGSLVKFHSGKVALEEPLKLQVRRFSVGSRKERRERGKEKIHFEPPVNTDILCDVWFAYGLFKVLL